MTATNRKIVSTFFLLLASFSAYAGNRNDTITVITGSTQTTLSYYYACDSFMEFSSSEQKTTATCSGPDKRNVVMGKTSSNIKTQLSIQTNKTTLVANCKMISIFSDVESTTYIFDCRQ